MTYGRRSVIPARSLVLEIAKKEAEAAGIPHIDVLTLDRRARVAWVRARICRTLRDMNYSLPSIGRALHCDHSTVHHQVTRTDLDDDPPPLHQKRAPKGKRHRLPVLVPKPALPEPTPSKKPIILESDFIPPIPRWRLMGAK